MSVDREQARRATATLVRRSMEAGPRRSWGPEARRLIDVPRGGRGRRPWQVLGGPGTGKTSLLVDLAVSRIADGGCDPESILVLTHSRRAATVVRETITAGLLGSAGPDSLRATREPLVRTVHSYAFAVLRLQAAVHSNPPPRLITGAEQDAVLREMLRGDVADGAQHWPERLRPALSLTGFAVELRDLMLRAGERGLGPEDLIALGRTHSRPEWVAAGRFAAHYEHVMLLRGAVGVEAPEATAPALDAAELVGAALTAFATDPELLQQERSRIRYLLVDDAQHLDPQAAELVRLIGAGTDLSVVAGDPDQAVFGFRGADPRFLMDLADTGSENRLILDTDHRCAERISAVTAAIAGRLPGLPPHRGAAAATEEPGRAQVQVLGTQGKEAALIADTLRRAHLHDGVPWSRMAVVVRSVPRVLAPLRRALLAAGVPVTTSASELPLARQHSVGGLLLVLRAVAGVEFTGEDALALVSGPVGGSDPVTLRRLRRGLRRVELASGGQRDSADLLRSLIVDGEDEHRGLIAKLSDGESAALRRVLSILGQARAAHRKGRGVEGVLWASWQATGLEKRWAAASLRGGPIGAQADRDLDAVVALFDAAASYVDRLPRATLAGFVEYLSEQQISSDSRSGAAIPGEAVTVLSAHSAAGREWDVVAVAGVQEGLWPGLRARGTLLGTEVLVDLTAGVGDASPTSESQLSRTAPLLAEERRLFLLACSRARRSLLITAVESATGESDLVPSRFVDELIGKVDGDDGPGESVVDQPVPAGRVLSLPSLVAELRRAVCDPDLAENDPQRQARAARQLARLARDGVRGAHPENWWGVGGMSTDAPLWEPDDGPVPLSPSTIEQLSTCPLRWALERNGGTDGENTHAVTGTLVHTLVQAVAGKLPPDQVRRALATAWDAVDLGSQWYSRREMDRTGQMLDSFSEWLRLSRGELTEVGVEVAVDGVLEPREEGGPEIRLRGRIDRLERDAEGRPVIVDVKTARSPVSKEAAQQHAQLATYQMAALAGAIEGEPPSEPGGARLVFVAKPNKKEGATQRLQSPLGEDGEQEWLTVVHDAAAATKGPGFRAQPNDGCRHCPARSSCPAQETGRQVTEG
ncbi:ATP-dependent helicase [Rhodococcus sp. NPDC055112]